MRFCLLRRRLQVDAVLEAPRRRPAELSSWSERGSFYRRADERAFWAFMTEWTHLPSQLFQLRRDVDVKGVPLTSGLVFVFSEFSEQLIRSWNSQKMSGARSLTIFGGVVDRS